MYLRIDEIPFAGEIALAQLTRDKDDFEAYSSMYDATYRTDFGNDLTAIKALARTAHMRAEGKKITETLYKDAESLRDPLNKLEGYVIRAKDTLTIAPKDFGIHEVREKLGKKDIEGLTGALTTLISNITDNVTGTDDGPLNVVGYKATDFTALKALAKKISDGNVSQTMQDEDQELTVKDNTDAEKNFIAKIKDVLDAGKRIYKFSNKTKYGEYTMSKLMTKMRQERNALKTEIKEVNASCSVYANHYDADGNPLENVLVKILEYELEVETDEEGVAYFENVQTDPKDTVTIVSTRDDLKDVTTPGVKLNPGGDTDADITMENL